MGRSLLEGAFAHHEWATTRLIEACGGLTSADLDTAIPGAYGSLLDTLRHLVSSDAFYMRVTSGEMSPTVNLAGATLSELRAAMAENAEGWSGVLASSPDGEAILREIDPEDGYQRDAPMGLRLVDALYHGVEHREQISTGLRSLGIEPPRTSVVDFGVASGVIAEIYPEQR